MLPIGSVGMITGWAGDRASSIRCPGLGASPYRGRGRLAISRLPLAQASLGCHLPLRSRAEVAQLVEQLIRNQQVTGSSPVFGSLYNQSPYVDYGNQRKIGVCHLLATFQAKGLCLDSPRSSPHEPFPLFEVGAKP